MRTILLLVLFASTAVLALAWANDDSKTAKTTSPPAPPKAKVEVVVDDYHGHKVPSEKETVM